MVNCKRCGETFIQSFVCANGKLSKTCNGCIKQLIHTGYKFEDIS